MKEFTIVKNGERVFDRTQGKYVTSNPTKTEAVGKLNYLNSSKTREIFGDIATNVIVIRNPYPDGALSRNFDYIIVDGKTYRIINQANYSNQNATYYFSQSNDTVDSELEDKPDNDTIYDDTEIKQLITDINNKISGLSEKVIALEAREDKDTVYDDTAIKKELSELNQSIAKKKLYLAYAYDRYGANGFTKADVYDPFDCLIFDYLGISEKDSDNPDDYFWMPTRVASDDELSEALFEVNKLKDLHRKAPTGYALDRTTVPWTIRFDNGCELRLPTSERDKANLIYGYGFPANNNSAAAFSAPIPPLIISASRGTFTVDKFKESDEAHFHITYADYILYYPIGKSNDFNWENAYGDRVNQTVSTNGKSNFTKLMYELGIWSEEDVLYLGATKK